MATATPDLGAAAYGLQRRLSFHAISYGMKFVLLCLVPFHRDFFPWSKFQKFVFPLNDR